MSDCIFCKIINGEIPSAKIYEDNDFIAVLDISPNALGHTLVLPKKHAEDIFSLDAEAAAKLMPVVRKVSLALQSAITFDGMNILQNNGVAAGQTVMHFHMHLIPRYKNDQMHVAWKKCSVSKEEEAALIEKLKQLL